MPEEVLGFDVVVVGSGIAGLTMALEIARAGKDVAVVTKKRLEDSSTNWAQGGIAGVLDSSNQAAIERHIDDTISAGAGVCDEELVRDVISEAAVRIRALIEEGVPFERKSDGEYDLAKEGGHQEKRILHVKDRTGEAIETTLIERLKQQNVTILEQWMAIDLVMRKRGQPQNGVRGIWCLDAEGNVHTICCRALVLATGGAGQLWRETTNPSVATGAGVAMAHRAGAGVKHLEFIQFHPTALAIQGKRPFLITEALRGHGAILMTIEGHQIFRKEGGEPENHSYMLEKDPRGSLATRDIVARTTDQILKKSGEPHALLVTEHLDSKDLKNRFPTIADKLQAHGIQFGPDPIPVTPAAHYIVGGIDVGKNGECITTNGSVYPGLYAIGEVASTGLHGANRLASNSLLEAIVMSHRARNHLLEHIDEYPLELKDAPVWRADGLHRLQEHAPIKADRIALRTIMSDDVGLVRRDERLNRALRKLDHTGEEIERTWRASKPTKGLVELRNMSIVARLVTQAAKKRRNNIGLHYNMDLE